MYIYFNNLFFILLSLIVLGYLIYVIKSQKRVRLSYELFFAGIFFVVALIFLFPGSVQTIEKILGIKSGANFIVYLSIFVIFIFLFHFQKKLDSLKEDITKLTRGIAYIKTKQAKNEKKN